MIPLPHLPRLRLVFALLALTAAELLTGATAFAATLTDGDDFSVQLPDTLCFNEPASLRDDQACAAIRSKRLWALIGKDSLPPGATRIGAASANVGEDEVARVVVMRLPATSDPVENDDDAAQLIAGVARSIAAEGRSAVGRVEPLRAKLFMTAQGLRMVRGSINFFNLRAGSEQVSPNEVVEKSMYMHLACAFVFTEDATYRITVTGPNRQQAEIDPILEDSLSTIRAQRPLRQSGTKRLFSADTMHIFMLMSVILFVVAVVVLLSRARAWILRILRGQ